jgi:hypothetical protein
MPERPAMSQVSHFRLWPFYKAFSTLNARSPLFAGTTRKFNALAPSKMLRALVPIYQWFLNLRREETRINIELLHVADSWRQHTDNIGGAVVLRRAVPDSAGVSTRRVVPALQTKRMEARLKRAVTAVSVTG